MTEQEFTELAEKHLTALQSYKMDKNGNFPIEIFGIEKLYKQLTLTDVSTRELPPWVRPLITIITMSLVTVYVIYKTFYVC